ncbi:unnamed protein product [Mytilus coruscus]|uniref:Endonuclease/exonuclease/phosphatase domain-containing protein n=1 Tax=Mytilus coruscus TaxID=42192 RepID=A0A6J8CZK0_MYTCO|nr:unnamed protein product [Mytilus coruscus]
MSKDLAQIIEQKVKHEVSQAKKEINGKLSSFKDQVNVLEGKVNSMEQSYASVVKQPSVNDEKKLNIVIKGLPHGKNEENNPQCTLNKVNSLIRDGLKLSNIKFLKTERKVSRDSKSGLIIAKSTLFRRQKVDNEGKIQIKGNKSFSSVYIENDIPWEVRSQQNNLRTILKEIGKSDKYRVVGSKIDNSAFRKSVLLCGDYDFIALCETFLRNSDTISVPGYRFVGKNRSVLHRNAKRGSGGVCFLIKDSVYKFFDVTLLDCSKEDILWIKLQEKGSTLCFCLCVCYLPPEGSSRWCDPETFFADLLYQVYKYQNEGTVCISGDFNSRIGYNTDFIEGVDRIPSREVIDKTENHYGDLFMDFLVDSNFCVLNGRIGNENNYTCVSKKGKSVVDYVVVPHESIPSVSDFKVNTISDPT